MADSLFVELYAALHDTLPDDPTGSSTPAPPQLTPTAMPGLKVREPDATRGWKLAEGHTFDQAVVDRMHARAKAKGYILDVKPMRFADGRTRHQLTIYNPKGQRMSHPTEFYDADQGEPAAEPDQYAARHIPSSPGQQSLFDGPHRGHDVSSEPRDAKGEWTKGGAAAPKSDAPEPKTELAAKLQQAVVDFTNLGGGTIVRGNENVEREAKFHDLKRSKHGIQFPKPIIGPSGAKLTGYDWKWTIFEDVDDRGEERKRRVSDWDEAVGSDDTGRNIVHQFSIATPGGDHQTVSLESALKQLGYMPKDKLSPGVANIKTLASALKRRAIGQMEIERRTDLLARMDQAIKQATEQAKSKPLPKIELVRSPRRHMTNDAKQRGEPDWLPAWRAGDVEHLDFHREHLRDFEAGQTPPKIAEELQRDHTAKRIDEAFPQDLLDEASQAHGYKIASASRWANSYRSQTASDLQKRQEKIDDLDQQIKVLSDEAAEAQGGAGPDRHRAKLRDIETMLTDFQHSDLEQRTRRYQDHEDAMTEALERNGYQRQGSGWRQARVELRQILSDAWNLTGRNPRGGGHTSKTLLADEIPAYSHYGVPQPAKPASPDQKITKWYVANKAKLDDVLQRAEAWKQKWIRRKPEEWERYTAAFHDAFVDRYARLKSQAGQRGLFDEQHPRGQPDNAGEFRPKSAAPSPFTPDPNHATRQAREMSPAEFDQHLQQMVAEAKEAAAQDRSPTRLQNLRRAEEAAQDPVAHHRKLVADSLKFKKPDYPLEQFVHPETLAAYPELRDVRAASDQPTDLPLFAKPAPAPDTTGQNPDTPPRQNVGTSQQVPTNPDIGTPGDTPREFWQMPVREFAKTMHDRTAPFTKSGRTWDKWLAQGIPEQDLIYLHGAGHEAYVKDAIDKGLPVPPEVLADYPDLKPAPAPGTTAPSAGGRPTGETLTGPGGGDAKEPSPQVAQSPPDAATLRNNLLAAHHGQLASRNASNDFLRKWVAAGRDQKDAYRTPEYQELATRDRAISEQAEQATNAYLDALGENIEGNRHWLHSWVGNTMSHADTLNGKLDEVESDAARRKRIEPYDDELKALGQHLQSIERQQPSQLAIGDHVLSDVYGRPGLFQVVKITHKGERTFGRDLRSGEVARLQPGKGGGYLSSATGYKKLQPETATRMAQLMDIQEGKPAPRPEQHTALTSALLREYYAQRFADRVVERYAEQQARLFDDAGGAPRKEFDETKHQRAGGQFARKFPRVQSKEVQPALPGVDLPGQRRIVTKPQPVGQNAAVTVKTSPETQGVTVQPPMTQLPDMRSRASGGLAASLPPPASAILPPRHQARHAELLAKGFRRTPAEQQEFQDLQRRIEEMQDRQPQRYGGEASEPQTGHGIAPQGGLDTESIQRQYSETFGEPVTVKPERDGFEFMTQSGIKAERAYDKMRKAVVLRYSFVPEHLRGQGLRSKLASADAFLFGGHPAVLVGLTPETAHVAKKHGLVAQPGSHRHEGVMRPEYEPGEKPQSYAQQLRDAILHRYRAENHIMDDTILDPYGQFQALVELASTLDRYKAKDSPGQQHLFKEEDHPRAPEGAKGGAGGQFVEKEPEPDRATEPSYNESVANPPPRPAPEPESRQSDTKTVANHDNEDLVARVQAGEQGAFDQLLAQNRPFIADRARKAGAREGHDIEDWIQEGSVILWRAAEKFDPQQGNKFLTYLGTALDRRFWKLREQQIGTKAKPKPRHLQGAVDDEGRPVHEPIASPDETPLAEQELKQAVRTVVERLPNPRHKQILQLAYGLDGPALTHAEIAEQLGVRPQAVQQQLARILPTLQRQLQDQYAARCLRDAVLERYHALVSGTPERYAKVKTPDLAPQGAESNNSVASSSPNHTETPEFKKWFGKSTVRHPETGKPLVVYHGTRKDFDKFDARKRRTAPGFYFTTSPDAAAGMGYDFNEQKFTEGTHLKAVHLRMENPFVTGDVDSNPFRESGIVEHAKAHGHDGVVFKKGDGTATYVVFRPHQIKSATGNRGTYSREDSRINYTQAFHDAYLDRYGWRGTVGDALVKTADWLKGTPPSERAAPTTHSRANPPTQPSRTTERPGPAPKATATKPAPVPPPPSPEALAKQRAAGLPKQPATPAHHPDSPLVRGYWTTALNSMTPTALSTPNLQAAHRALQGLHSYDQVQQEAHRIANERSRFATGNLKSTSTATRREWYRQNIDQIRQQVHGNFRQAADRAIAGAQKEYQTNRRLIDQAKQDLEAHQRGRELLPEGHPGRNTMAHQAAILGQRINHHETSLEQLWGEIQQMQQHAPETPEPWRGWSQDRPTAPTPKPRGPTPAPQPQDPAGWLAHVDQAVHRATAPAQRDAAERDIALRNWRADYPTLKPKGNPAFLDYLERAKPIAHEALQRRAHEALGSAEQWFKAQGQTPPEELAQHRARLEGVQQRRSLAGVADAVPVAVGPGGERKPITEASLARQEARKPEPAMPPKERAKSKAQVANELNAAHAAEYGWTPRQYHEEAARFWQDRVERATALESARKAIGLTLQQRKAAAQGADEDAVKGLDTLTSIAGEHGLPDMTEEQLHQLATRGPIEIPGPHQDDWHEQFADHLRQRGIVTHRERQEAAAEEPDETPEPDHGFSDQEMDEMRQEAFETGESIEDLMARRREQLADSTPFSARRAPDLRAELYSALWWATTRA